MTTAAPTTSFWTTLPQPILGLSPMDGVTDAAFRLIAARHGRPDLIMTEFTHVEGICRGIPAVLRNLDYHPDERPVVAQVFGSEPEAFYKAAHVVAALGFDGLDINMGCPDKAVAGHGCGAALIRTPDRAQAIIRAAQSGMRDWADGRDLASVGLAAETRDIVRRMMARVGASDHVRRALPVSVKTRLGYDRVVIDSWIDALLETEPAAISVHGRTLAQRYSGDADWDAIARAAERTRRTATLALGNGDLRSPSDVVRRVRETHVHGVLIGRAAMGNPWIFRVADRLRAACADPASPAPAPPVVDSADRWAVAREHAALFERLRDHVPFTVMRKHLGWYVRGPEDRPGLRARLMQVRTLAELDAVLTDATPRAEAGTRESARVASMTCG
ncbi:MAG: tRNA dihydrouridine synthase [Nitrospirota bacterium]